MLRWEPAAHAWDVGQDYGDCCGATWRAPHCAAPSLSCPRSQIRLLPPALPHAPLSTLPTHCAGKIRRVAGKRILYKLTDYKKVYVRIEDGTTRVKAPPAPAATADADASKQELR